VILETLTTTDVMISGVTNTSQELTRTAIFLARLLQFNLGFTGMWSSSCIEVHEGISFVLFRLLLVSLKKLVHFPNY